MGNGRECLNLTFSVCSRFPPAPGSLAGIDSVNFYFSESDFVRAGSSGTCISAPLRPDK